MPDLAYDLAGGATGTVIAPYYGTFAARPAAGSAGRLAFVTDSPIQTWVDDGSAWRPLINGVIGTAPPAVAGMTWVNQGGASATANNGAIALVGVNDGAPPGQLRGKVLTNSASTAYAELGFAFQLYGDITASHFNGMYAWLRESATAKSYGLDCFQDFNSRRTTIQAEVWSSDSARTTNVDKGYVAGDPNQAFFTRVRRNGANLFAEVSRDRQTWIQVDTRTTASVFTTAPDQAGFACNGINCIAASNIFHFISGS